MEEIKQISEVHAKQMEALWNIVTKKEPICGDDEKYDLERENKDLIII